MEWKDANLDSELVVVGEGYKRMGIRIQSQGAGRSYVFFGLYLQTDFFLVHLAQQLSIDEIKQPKLTGLPSILCHCHSALWPVIFQKTPVIAILHIRHLANFNHQIVYYYYFHKFFTRV